MHFFLHILTMLVVALMFLILYIPCTIYEWFRSYKEKRDEKKVPKGRSYLHVTN